MCLFKSINSEELKDGWMDILGELLIRRCGSDWIRSLVVSKPGSAAVDLTGSRYLLCPNPDPNI